MSLYVALVHHPCRDRRGDIVTTAVTNIDVHDFARMTRTYQAAQCYIVTPITAQRELIDGIARHWREGPGKKRVPTRSAAFETLSGIASVDDAHADILAREGRAPTWVATAAARDDRGLTSYAELGARIRDEPVLLLFGTGHGLTDAFLDRCDAQLPPIRPRKKPCDFNHLSVRTAAAIILDRLLGDGDLPQD